MVERDGELLDTLKTVHINMSYWETIESNGVLHVTSWGVHLVDIVEFYETTMGKKIYYH